MAGFSRQKLVCHYLLFGRFPLDGYFTRIGERIITTFFECEMDFSFINTITGLKNMEIIYRYRRFLLRRE